MDEEMRFHLQMEIEAHIRKGLPRDQARKVALDDFGGMERFKELSRDERGGRGMDDLAQDVRFTARRLLQTKVFTLVVLLTLALGIGANSAIFTLVDSILLQPLPFPSSERLVRVYQTAPARGSFQGSLSLPDGRDWEERSEMVEAMGLYLDRTGGFIYTGGDQATEVRTAYVSGGFFPTLGTPALHGRTLLPQEEEADNHVLVLSYGYWLREMGADPDVIGRLMDMEGVAYRMVGVMPPTFNFPSPDVEVWAFLTVIKPASIPLQLRQVRILDGVARLAPDVTLEEAQAQLSAVAQGLEREFAEDSPEVVGANLIPLQESVVGDVRLALLVLLGAVGFILIIACANIANMLLARGLGRGREMAVRAALGAQRSRLIQQLLTESVILGLMGGAVGLLVAIAGVKIFVARSSGLLPRGWEVGIRWEVLLFTLAASLFTGLIFGLPPALAGSKMEPSNGLRTGPQRGSTTGGQQRLRQGLVSAQVALAVILLVGAGLMVRSLVTLQQVDPGFRAQGLLGVTISLSDALFEERADYMAAYRTLMDGYSGLPGVEGVASIRHLPLRGPGEQWNYTVLGDPPTGAGLEPSAWTLQASADLFRVMEIPILAGRTFTPDEIQGGPWAVVINETMAREAFGDRDPIGQTLLFSGQEVRVVGLVGDVHQESLREAPEPTAYLHQEQVSRSAMTFLLRTTGSPLRLASEVRRVTAELDPGQAIRELVDVEDLVGTSTARSRFITLLLSCFALLAFTLATLGIFGVVAYLMARQTREIGIRLALGAKPSEAVGLVLSRGLGPVVVGLAVGVVLALLLSRLLGTLLFGVSPSDPLVYIMGVGLLLAAAVVASVVPARRTLREDPISLLRLQE
jgi:predicted permease